jgi:hypothetical protein
MSPNDPSPRTIRLVSALLLLATFAAGSATGGALVHWGAKREPPSRPMPGPMPWVNLDLSEAQRKQSFEILERYRPKLDSIFNDTAPKVRAITDQVDREVRAILTADQQTRFDRVLAERRNGPPRPPDGMRPPLPDGMHPPLPGDLPPPPFGGPPGPPPGSSLFDPHARAPAPQPPSDAGLNVSH